MLSSDARQPDVSDEDTHEVAQQSDSENEAPAPVINENGKGQQSQRTMQRTRRQQQPQYAPAADNQVAQQRDERRTGNMGGRTGAVRESRIKDRPAKVGEKDSSLKIKIELDLEVEVDLYARVKGDVTIGLM